MKGIVAALIVLLSATLVLAESKVVTCVVKESKLVNTGTILVLECPPEVAPFISPGDKMMGRKIDDGKKEE